MTNRFANKDIQGIQFFNRTHTHTYVHETSTHTSVVEIEFCQLFITRPNIKQYKLNCRCKHFSRAEQEELPITKWMFIFWIQITQGYHLQKPDSTPNLDSLRYVSVNIGYELTLYIGSCVVLKKRGIIQLALEITPQRINKLESYPPHSKEKHVKFNLKGQK